MESYLLSYKVWFHVPPKLFVFFPRSKSPHQTHHPQFTFLRGRRRVVFQNAGLFQNRSAGLFQNPVNNKTRKQENKKTNSLA